MFVVACSLVQRYFGVVVVAAGTIGGGIPKEDNVDEEIVHEEIDFMDGSFSNQETKNVFGLIVVPKVTKS